MRYPNRPSELPKDAAKEHKHGELFHCLLSDDSLVSRISVTTDTLLDANDNDVVLIITVTVKRRSVILGNLSYIE